MTSVSGIEKSVHSFTFNGNDQANMNLVKYLSFFLDKKLLGINIHAIKEIIEYDGVTHVPLTSAHIHGMLNLRGNIVPVINLAERIGFGSKAVSGRSCIVIVEMPDNEARMDLGIVVDSVNEVIDIEIDQVETAPSFGSDVQPEFIEGMVENENDFIVMLDIAKVLDIDELSQLACTNQ